ncbi:alpha/beta fold hydrolase [Leptobacterium flavescens]|uniref:Alpha/beta fold hydrolase n=1 Tax=Leptobacterium flavescens TaxID=472055 RepID=A0A6P0UMK0_9FLAO|nr:alpha/beta fold hydrolase [Leptobacterium flavescens]NER14425.1 alpha/beta fold hydrolase [Leptobacterium flavescens]
MPLIRSDYKPPHLFKNGHFSTIYSGLVRKVNGIRQERERIDLSDGDFIDLDWSFSASETGKLIVVIHGLEGNAQRPYVTGVARLFNQNGIDAVCVNLRSCSGEVNKLFRSYHSGATEDLVEIMDHITTHKKYTDIYINGFSLGGNLSLKYAGEGNPIPEQLKAIIAVSVPCYLYGSMLELHKRKNFLYARRFKQHLLEKLKEKQKKFPEKINGTDISKIITLKDFDDVYTSKAHGFKDALDYYEKASSLPHLHNIKIPTLILNARNDSFLSEECFPMKEAEKNSNLFLEIPDHGGHVGFYAGNRVYYNEKRALEFINENAI